MELDVLIFSMTADQSFLSGEIRVTIEPPLASSETPASWESIRQPGDANCVVWASDLCPDDTTQL